MSRRISFLFVAMAIAFTGTSRASSAPPAARPAPVDVRVRLAVLPGSKFMPAWAHLLGRAQVTALMSGHQMEWSDAAKIKALEPEHLATVTIVNTGNAALERLKVEVELSGYSDLATETADVPAQKQRVIRLTPNFNEKLFLLREQTGGTVRVKVSNSQGESLYDKTTLVTLLSVNDMIWEYTKPFDLAPMICTFITPRTPEVDRILAKAGNKMDGRAITGYQGDKKDATAITRSHLKAIYQVIAEMGVHYVNTPVSFGGGQQIKYIDQILARGSEAANCIEGANTFAACLEAAGMRPIIIIIPGHAFVGCYTWDDNNEFLPVETTMVGTNSYEQAEAEALKIYKDCVAKKEILWFLPVAAYRAMGITPGRRPGTVSSDKPSAAKHSKVTDSSDPLQWIACGKDHLTRSENETAQGDFSKAIEIDAEADEAYVERAKVKHILGNFKGAVKDCSMAIRVRNKAWAAYYQRGLSNFAMRKYPDALDDWHMALGSGAPNKAELKRLIAAAEKKVEGDNAVVDESLEDLKKQADDAYAAKEYAKAVELYTKILQTDREWGHGWNYRGLAQYYQAHYPEALSDCTEAIKFGLLEAYGTVGSAHYMMGHYREAVAAWEVYLKNFPDQEATFRPWVDKAKAQCQDADATTQNKWDKDKAHPWAGFQPGSSVTLSFSVTAEGETSEVVLTTRMIEKSSTQVHLEEAKEGKTTDTWKDIREFALEEIGLAGNPKWVEGAAYDYTIEGKKYSVTLHSLKSAVADNGARLDVNLYTFPEAAAVGGIAYFEANSKDGTIKEKWACISLRDAVRLKTGKTVNCVKYRNTGTQQGTSYAFDMWISAEVPGWIVKMNGTYGASSQSWICTDFTTGKIGEELTAEKVEDYIDRVVKLINEKKYDEAVTLSNEAIQKFPNNHILFYNLAVADYYLQKDREAMEAIAAVIKLSPGYANAYRLRGLVHYSGKNWSSAAEDFAYAIELNPDLKEITQKYLDECRRNAKKR